MLKFSLIYFAGMSRRAEYYRDYRKRKRIRLMLERQVLALQRSESGEDSDADDASAHSAAGSPPHQINPHLSEESSESDNHSDDQNHSDTASIHDNHANYQGVANQHEGVANVNNPVQDDCLGADDSDRSSVGSIGSYHSDVASDSDQVEEEEEERPDPAVSLIEWFDANHPTLTSLQGVLNIFNEQGIAGLPKDHRTLLKTPRRVETIEISGSEFYNFGVSTGIRRAIANAVGPVPDTIDIINSTDGLPLYSANNNSAWPVLMSVENFDSTTAIFPASVTVCRDGKPTNVDFLQETIDEMNQLMESGLAYDDKVYNVHFRCWVCDAQARFFIKRVVQGQSAYRGCDQCCQVAVRTHNRMTWPDARSYARQARTDAEFRSGAYGDYHHGQTILLQQHNLDMIKDFPIDYMHNVCLGVTKKVTYDVIQKLNRGEQSILNAKLKHVREFIPNSFARRPRPIKEFAKWKATEFRQICLYTGPVLFKGTMTNDQYMHFMSLTVGIRILISPEYVANPRLLNVAQEMLCYFNEMGGHVYSASFNTFNVHGLVHLPCIAQQFGSIEKVSAWKFENYLHQLKRRIKSGKNPLVQIVKRLSEVPIKTSVPTPVRIQTNEPNNCYVLANGNPVVVISENRDGTFQGQEYVRNVNFFEHPFPSSQVGITVCLNPLNAGATIVSKFRKEAFKRQCLRIVLMNQNEDGQAARNVRRSPIYFASLLHCSFNAVNT